MSESTETVYVDNSSVITEIFDAHSVRKMLDECHLFHHYSSEAELESDVSLIVDVIQQRRRASMSKEPF